MRLHRGVSTLAVIASFAGFAAPEASARFDNSYYPALNGRQNVTHHSGGSSTGELALVAAGAAGGVALVGAGVGRSRRTSRRTASGGIRTASGS